MPSFLDHALQYARLGWPVFPLQPKGKVPDGRFAPHGFKDATRDEAVICAWWTAEPEANIGVPTGAPSGFWVLDVDPRNGGNEELAALLETYRATGFATLMQRTGGGGVHYLFAHSPHVRKGKLGKGLDVKRDGGYIVVAPSVTQGAYAFDDFDEWEPFAGEVAPVQPAPDWLLTLVAVQPGPERPQGDEPWNADFAKLRSALAVLGADDYDKEWIPVGAALYHGSQGHAQALDLWIEWSRKSAAFEDGACEKRWAGFGKYADRRATIASIYWRAQQQGWRWGKPKAKKPDAPPPAPMDGHETPPPAEPDRGGRPCIKWIEGELPRIVSDAESALLKAGLRLYQRAGSVVRVIERDIPSVRNYGQRSSALSTTTVDTPWLIETLTRVAHWERWDKRIEDFRRINCPEQVAATYLARRYDWRLPNLKAVISAPTLRPDGTILQSPGYDAGMQTFYDPLGVEFPDIPETPTREQAEAALVKLRRALGTFPFKSGDNGPDVAVAISLVLTALIRRSLPASPMGVISAPTPSSGKSLLADCISIIATGYPAPAMNLGETDEEFVKTASTLLVEGAPIILIDNVERPLAGEWLCTALTSEVKSIRILGRTESVNVPTTTLWMATGNHMVIAGDMRTRALMCVIDPQMERPEERPFTHDLREWMMRHRPALVVAGLTIIRAFVVSGNPTRDIVSDWSRFDRWSNLVRAPLVWLGMSDPYETVRAIEDGDPARVTHQHVISAWYAAFGTESYSAREAVARCGDAMASDDQKTFLVAIGDVATNRRGQMDSKQLGKWIARHADRIVAGLKFTAAGERDHTKLWKVIRMDSS